MRRRNSMAICIIAILLTGGCYRDSILSDTAAPSPVATTPADTQSPDTEVKPLAWAGEQWIGRDDLWPMLLEAAGSSVLAEYVLGRAVERALVRRQLTVTERDLKQEQQIVTSALDPDPDQAQRLLTEMRRRRSLGPRRFDQMLHRNAGLRLLVQEQVQIDDQTLRTAYELVYGRKYETRLITVTSLADAQQLRERAQQGEPFIDLAIEHSTDSSRVQGGLLPLISPADPTFPQAVRDAVARLQPGQVSAPVPLELGIALLKLESVVEKQDVSFEQVKQELELRVRRQKERNQMRALARQLLAKAEVRVFDATLNRSWNENTAAIVEP